MTESPPQGYRETIPAAACTPEGMASLAHVPDRTSSTAPRDGTDGSAPRVPGHSVRARLSGRPTDARFRVGDLLGLGATGEVYGVEDTDLDRRVALKILRTDLATQPSEVDSFLQEARTTARLSHPNMLPVLDFNVAEDGRPFFTMHRVHGRTLMDALSLTGGLGRTTRPAGVELTPTAPTPIAAPADAGAASAAASSPAQRRRAINRLVSIAIAVCHGLGYAHAQGLIHQDIKPDNILLGDFGEVLILDWGSAGSCGSDGRVEAGSLYGTPLYMSPEQASRTYADPRSDVYALGATLFHALVGRVPWWRPEPAEFWEGKRAGRWDRPTVEERARVPGELWTIIDKAMAADPAQRYPSVVAMRRDLEQFQAGLTVSAHHYALWTLVWRWMRHHPGTASAAAVALLALAGLVATLAHWRALEARTWHRMERLTVSPQELQDETWHASHDLEWGSNPKPLPLPSPLLTFHDGWMTLDGDKGLIDVAHTPLVRGNERITWEVRNPVNAKNFNCFIGGDNRTQGITIHVGGYNVPSLVLMTQGDRQLERAILPVPMQEHRIYRFQLEHEDQHVRFWIDDRLIFDHVDVDDALGAKSQTFGFDTYVGSQLQIRHVEVFQQTPGQLVSPLLTPDRLAQLQLWPEAIRDYRELAHSYPGTPLATIAEFHAAECTAASGDKQHADSLYADFVQHHPGDALVPYALVTRLSLAVARRETTKVQQLREDLTAFAGNPLLAGVLWQIGQELARQIPPDWEATAHPDQALTTITNTLRTFDHWRVRFGLAPSDTAFIEDAVSDLLAIGRADIALHLLHPESSLRVKPLLDEGRIEEAEAADHANFVDWIRGRSQEIAANPDADWGARQHACADIGDFVKLREINPYAELLYEEHLSSPADAEVYLAHHALDNVEKAYGCTTRVQILLRLGRIQEVLDTYTLPDQPVPHDMALVAAGRYDEACAPGHGCVPVRQRAAIGLIAQGHAAKAMQLIDAAPEPLNYSDVDDICSRCMLPELVHVAAGDASGARRMLEAWTGHKNAGKQRFWYLASFVLGRIDEATFRQQPYQRAMDQWVTLARALQCELAGDVAGARRYYRTLVPLPIWHRDFSGLMQDWIGMRLQQTGEQLPWNWGIDFILRGGALSTR